MSRCASSFRSPRADPDMVTIAEILLLWLYLNGQVSLPILGVLMAALWTIEASMGED